QAQYILCSLQLPDDTFLKQLLPFLHCSTSCSQWLRLHKSLCWQRCSSSNSNLDIHSLKSIRHSFLRESLSKLQNGRYS
ncbi:hypothetical protein BD560DRAFT_318550, partial [Blakeslea trispora]